MASLIRDLTGEKKTQSELISELEDLRVRASELSHIADESNKFYDALNSSINGVIITNLQREIVYANPAFLNMFEYTVLDELVGKNPGDLFVSEDVQRLADIEAIIGRSEGQSVELDVQRRDGTRFPVEVSVSKVTDNQGNVTGRMASLVDITRRKDAEAALKEHAEALDDANRMKGLFMDILSHDLLNPLLAISISVDQLKGLIEPSGDARFLITTMDESAQKAMNLVQDAAMYSKLESAGSMKKEKTDLFLILYRAIRELQPVIGDGISRLNVVYGENNFITGNPIVGQVFTNLISNALKYSPREAKIDVGITEGEESFTFYVRDRGDGISEENKKRLFTRFERLGKEGVRGTGLGLAIVKRIVDMHGGTIWVEDNPGGGSIFSVRFPKWFKNQSRTTP